jgi:glycosyltransferase involved in cell wall biosynthesis
MTTISIAMATYNGARFIREQLESIASQNHRPSEIVVTDDCSSDNTLELVTEFARTAPFPVIAQRNKSRLGFKENFLQAVGLCSSDLIACCDQDDVWLPNKLENIAPVFNDPDVMLVHHNSFIVNNSGEVLGFLRDFGIPATLSPHEADPWFSAYGHTLTFRKELAQFSALWRDSVSAHSSEEKIAVYATEQESHDHWFFFLASELGKVCYQETPLVNYRQHGSNAEGWGGKMSYIRKWRHRLERRDIVYDLCAKSATARAKILENMSRLIEDERKSVMLQDGSMRYEKLAWLYDNRAQLYRSNQFFPRLILFFRLVKAHAYDKRGFWTFHSKGAAKDVVLGLFASRLLRYVGVPAAGNDPTCSAVRPPQRTVDL